MPTETPRSRKTAPKTAAPAAKAPARRRSTKTSDNGSSAPVIGLARVVDVDAADIASLLRELPLPAPSALSPLPGLMAGTAGGGRPTKEILLGWEDAAPVAIAQVLAPLAIPDRVLDTRAAVFNGTPLQTRLYSSDRVGKLLAGVRAGGSRAVELVAPFSLDDLEMWLQLQLQYTAGKDIPLPDLELSGEQLAFLLVLVDAYKVAFVRSFGTRKASVTSVGITLADILQTQNDSLAVPDRRWISYAIAELLSTLVHPGGATDIRLPVVTEDLAKRELRRYAERGDITPIAKGPNALFEVGVALGMFAGSLFTWISMVLLHDSQVTGARNGRAAAQEELLLYVVNQETVWTLVSAGLTGAGSDLSNVRFGLRGLDLVSAVRFGRQFLEPAAVSLPDEVYAGVAAVPAPAAAPAAVPTAPPAPAGPPPVAPAPWKATHLVPAGGMQAWEKPDPSAAPIANLEARVDVQVTEELGAWAHIVCSNGWSAWVDGRYLERVN
jgi:hypothetical protein